MSTNLDNFVQYMVRKAESLRLDAGYSGAMDDGGAGALNASIATYEAGRAGVIPDAWKKDYNNYIKQQDPEYAKYLELKKKFE